MSAGERLDDARGLQLRLFSSYLLAFAIVSITAAAILHFTFVAVVREQTKTRLVDVARAGERSVIFGSAALKIDQAEIRNGDLLRRRQGLQWLTPQGRVVAAQGLIPSVNGSHAFIREALPIVNRSTRRLIGFIVATELRDDSSAPAGTLDAGLLVGALLIALLAAGSSAVLVRRAVARVERSVRVLREFTDNASHELRGPLTAIIANADASLRDASRDPELDRRRFETISDSANQMARLSADLLILARADRPLERELFRVEISSVVDRLCRGHRWIFERARLAFDVSIEEGLVIYGNPDQIDRVVLNLLDNALRYTPAGGSVRVKCRRRGAYVEILVCDSGIGIARVNEERVFERFWRVNPATEPKGSGLGLAIARSLARRHGGDVRLTSVLGYGSTFVAEFPIMPMKARGL